MPRGRPKRRVALRLDHDLVAEVQSLAGPGKFTAVIERLLAAWLKQARRKGADDPLAKHLAPPTPRELAAGTDRAV
jgi:hypothetical protein